jgi:nicotinamide-nucleotide amidase
VKKVLKTTGLEIHRVRSSLWDLIVEEKIKLDSHLLGVDIIIDQPQAKVPSIEEKIRSRLGDYIYGMDEETLEKVVGYLLSLQGLLLGVAESCTGGLLMNRITNVPGSSNYLRGGVVAYSEEIKTKLLSVPKKLIEEKGVVNEDVALEMASGVKKLLSVDIGVAITGIAGPGGGDKIHPVGEVFIALVLKEKRLVKRFRFSGNREEIKLKATQAALDMVRRELIYS